MSQGALNNDKDYLGDGVYINHDNFHTILTTEDGMSVQNTIYLEPGMSKKIMGYEARMRDKYKKSVEPIDRSQENTEQACDTCGSTEHVFCEGEAPGA